MPERAARRGATLGRAQAAAGLALAAGLIHLALIQPNHPQAATWGAFRVFPLELPVILIALALARGRWAAVLRALVAGALGAMVLVKLADLAGYAALGRPVNPALDLHLADSGWRLLSGAVGTPVALAASAGVLLTAAAVFAALWWATGRLAGLAPAGAARPALAALLAVAGAAAVADAAGEASPLDPPGAAFTARLGWEHARDAARARVDLAAFRAAAAQDPVAPSADAMAGLRGIDVLLVFVESYGRVTHENPFYAATIGATLKDLETDLAAAGLAARSGWLTSPVVGGQSWLAHASLLAGLEVDSEARYRALMASPPRALPRIARAAGWRTVAVMPAITRAWPDGAWFGYDRLMAARDLGYAGPAFNWVTMPDQFALAAFERAELGPGARAPVFAEIALISSHAPWTPIPPLLPWDALGDGRVFAPYAAAGSAPDELWRDPEAVRGAFRAALDYSLRAVGAFALRQGADPPLLIVLGDHQPAPVVAAGAVGRDVPAHVIGPAALVDRFAAWGWRPGLAPGTGPSTGPMSAFRDRFLAAFADAEPAPCVAAPVAPGPLPAPAGC
jgi:hypothetical protein